jgi:hypothetical protein
MGMDSKIGCYYTPLPVQKQVPTDSAIHETKIKMAKMVKMVEMVEIISTWTLPKVEMAEITSYYIILIRYK